jgi:hypothetical protein
MGRLQNFVGGKLGPPVRHLFSDAASVVGHDDPLDRCIQLKPGEAFAGALADEAHPLIDGMSPPCRTVRRQRAAVAESEPRETDDVGFARRQGKEVPRRAAWLSRPSWRVHVLHCSRSLPAVQI